MTLAFASSHTAPVFNGLYYATVATVIPVLFLAIAIQGRAYDNLVNAMARGLQEYKARLRDIGSAEDDGVATLRRLTPADLVTWLRIAGAGLIAGVILLFGVEAEIEALLALYFRRTMGGPAAPLAAAIFLAAAVAAVPAVALCRNLWLAIRLVPVPGLWQEQPAGHQEQGEEAGTSGSDTPSTEPDHPGGDAART